MSPILCYALDNACFKFYHIDRAERTAYRVNSLLPTDFATLASQDGNPYRLIGATDFLAHVASNRGPPPSP